MRRKTNKKRAKSNLAAVRIFAYVVLLMIPAAGVFAHEAWLQPVDWEVSADGRIAVDVMAGENFSGHSLSFNPARFSKVQMSSQAGVRNISGRLGDLPAIQIDPDDEGLHTIVYQTTGSEITYKSQEQFQSFARKEGVEWVIQAHADRKLPQHRFSETFYRYCKTLVGVGHANGEDKYMEMPFELIALENPMRRDIQSLTVQLLWQGEVDAGLLSVYRKTSGGQVYLDTYPVDSLGRVSIPLLNNSSYLLNAVKMEAIRQKEADQPVWRSHWASLTFATARDS